VPTLVVVSGPIGAGKTTLAHQLARAVGCPAICRDEIKEGMAHASLALSLLYVAQSAHAAAALDDGWSGPGTTADRRNPDAHTQ
jgi:deoxyadenosine/deoxycytidine kinase